MTKSWAHVTVLNLWLIGVITKLRAMIDNHVPLGYQDEAGFRFGIKPSDQKPLF
jgi:hypothetical protein